ncbi:GIN domain-containing protein [Gramella sp. KN1008]|uniref:GIN domain-containing protein n=1 Tax=Gramella sp. KN1008 TaxID=2529298 RepID=UPI00103ADD95|nr:DUF2807 domain-containing protein [Gramella sp. KN1008]TBW28922.1 hypothetical protein EZJ28_03305 [Gramella sp. KN1008]
MIKKLPFLILLILFSCQAQEKVKGSRNVKTEEYNLTPFHSIQISGDFEVGILKGSRPMMEIRADDNLHDLIQSEVVGGVLYIKPVREFSRTKSQEIRITFSDTLRNIQISDKVELESLEDLFVQDFQLKTRDNSKAFITLTARNFNLIHGDDSRAELNVTATEVYYQLNQSSRIEALVNAPLFKVDIYEKANARIDGDIEEFELRADQSAEFDGENLACVNAVVLAEGDSENKVNVIENLQLRAKGNSETEIFNTPNIELLEFTDEAVIAKKEFGKGLFN